MAERLLRLYVDRLAARGDAVSLAPACRVVYVREGAATVRAAGQVATLAPNSAWHGAGECAVRPGATGATLLRWELAPVGAPVAHGLLLEARGELDSPDGYLMRCDRVDFPPGGIAYTHTHQGPGIRCLLTGTLRVEVNGHAQDHGPGGAWFEAGPDPVLALAAQDQPTSFARCMILSAALQGKSSIRYVRPEDADKPKTQTYQVFVDERIDP